MLPQEPAEHDVKCPACGADLKLETSASDAPVKAGPKLSAKPAPKKNAASMPMDSLKQSIMGAQKESI